MGALLWYIYTCTHEFAGLGQRLHHDQSGWTTLTVLARNQCSPPARVIRMESPTVGILKMWQFTAVSPAVSTRYKCRLLFVYGCSVICFSPVASLVQRGVWSCLEGQSISTRRVSSSWETVEFIFHHFQSSARALRCTSCLRRFCLQAQHNTGRHLLAVTLSYR